MANIKISDMTAAANASGTQEYEVNDSGTTKKVTGAQISTYVRGQVTLGDLGITSTNSELNLLDGSVENTVTNSKAVIYGASGQITANQLDLLAQGDLRLQDSSGGQYVALQAPATISSNYTLTMPTADGSADQVLATNGSGTLSFVDAGGGSTTKISTTEITSSVANVNITIPTTGYTYVYAHLEGMHPSSNNVYLELKSSLDGGSTFENVTYASMQVSNSVGGVYGTTTDLRLNYGNTLGDSARQDISGFIYFSLKDAADTTNIQYNIGVNRSTGQQYGALGYAKMTASTNSHINSIRLEASSGNLVKGKITLYGVA